MVVQFLLNAFDIYLLNFKGKNYYRNKMLVNIKHTPSSESAWSLFYSSLVNVFIRYPFTVKCPNFTHAYYDFQWQYPTIHLKTHQLQLLTFCSNCGSLCAQIMFTANHPKFHYACSLQSEKWLFSNIKKMPFPCFYLDQWTPYMVTDWS